MNQSSFFSSARFAGICYLIVVITGMFYLAYVPSKLIVWDDAAATYLNLKNNLFLFRLGILAGVICYLAFLALPFVLFSLLKQINTSMARAMIILVVVSVAISFVNLITKLQVLSIVGGLDFFKTLGDGANQNLVMLLLNQYDNGILMLQVFWGLWLFPFGYLSYKSGLLPKFLSILLMIGCFSYLINFCGILLFDQYQKMGISTYVRLPASIGEIGSCLWLLFRGNKSQNVS